MSDSKGLLAPSAKFLEMKKQCPDLVNPLDHLRPKKFVMNAATAAILSVAETVATVSTLQLKLLKLEEDGEDDKKLEEVREENNKVLASAPAGIIAFVIRDFLGKSVHRVLETIVVNYASVDVCRSLTLSLGNEAGRIDNGANNGGDVLAQIKTAALASILYPTSTMLVMIANDTYNILSTNSTDKGEQLQQRALAHFKYAAKSIAVTAVFFGIAFKIHTVTNSKMKRTHGITSTLANVAVML